MKTHSLFAAIALTIAAASGPVLAQEARYDYAQPIVSQTSRAAVLAELQVARAEGTLQLNEASVGSTNRTLSLNSRDSVRVLALQGQRDGSIAALTAEPQGFTVAAAAATPLTVARK